MASLNNKVEKAKKNFKQKNGTKLESFSIKEIVLMQHQETITRCEKIEETLDKHLEWSQNNLKMGNKFMRDHDICIAEITEKLAKITQYLPEKGR